MSVTDPKIPEPLRFAISIPWLVLFLVGWIGICVAVGHVWDQYRVIFNILIFGGILTGAILGVTVVWSTGSRGVFESIAGGAIGCAISLGGLGFFGTLLIPSEPGTEYKWGDGIFGAIAGLLCDSVGGGLCGSVVGLVFGFAWVMRKRSHGKDFVLLAMIFPEQTRDPVAWSQESGDVTAQ
jgi:hypothetical protein